ncbi:hypothetical protein Lepto7375DRAFT_1930 [Leptolyngbya sp. PCC 7375]|nr:hypothetical protein Lepto7375DRAFT_1930 [Leptolyngbya sp. PCC 7375]
MDDTNYQTALNQLADALKKSPEFGRQIKVQVCQGNEEIRIFVDGYVLPERQKYLPKVRQVLQQVHLKTPYPIQVYGRRLGDILPRWQTRLAPNLPLAKAATTIPHQTSELGMDWGSVSTVLERVRQSQISQSVRTLWSQPWGRWGAIALGSLTCLLLVFLGSRGVSPSLSSDPIALPSHGDALKFDGKDDIAITSPGTIPPFNSAEAGFSVAVWVNPTRFTKYARIIERSDALQDDRMLLVIDHEVQGIRFSLSGNYAIASGLPLNEWSHVVGTYDGQTIRVYINGELKSSASYRGQIDLDSSELMLGNNRENSRPYVGLIKDVQIWQRTLSDAEVVQTMTAMPANDAPRLLATWSFASTIDSSSAYDEVNRIPLNFLTTKGVGDGPTVVKP